MPRFSASRPDATGHSWPLTVLARLLLTTIPLEISVTRPKLEWTTPALLAALLLGTTGPALAEDEMAETVEAATEAVDEAVTEAEAEAATMDDGFESDAERRGYAIGMDIGKNFKAQGLDVDVDALYAGLKDASGDGELRMDEAKAQEVLMALQQEMQMKAMQQQMKVMAEQAEANTTEGATFLEANGQKDGVKTTESGLQWMMIEEGDGEKPGPNDTVTVHYKGQLLDGTVFDSSYERGEPASFPLTGVIPGFAEGLQLFPVGSKGKLFIPGDLAYGQGQGPGGPNATLIFDIEVIDSEAPASTSEGAELPALGD